MRPLRRLIHAAKMVWRNRKRYAFLSVTIVLSFSLLLGYLLYTSFPESCRRFRTRTAILFSSASLTMATAW